MFTAAAKVLPAAGQSQRVRMAGTAWQQFAQWLKNSLKYAVQGNTKTWRGPSDRNAFFRQLAYRAAPDILGGTMVGITTPGDTTDKIIAGTTDALGGIAGGVGAVGALRGVTRGSRMGNYIVDIAGSYGGAYTSMPIADAFLRQKDVMTGGEGKTPYEYLNAERRKQIEESIIAKLGYGPLY